MKFVLHPVFNNSANNFSSQPRKYVLASPRNGLVATVDPGQKKIVARPWDEGEHQQWRIDPIMSRGEEYFRITHVATGLILTMLNAHKVREWLEPERVMRRVAAAARGRTIDPRPEVLIRLHPWKGWNSQRWTISRSGNSRFGLGISESETVLDLGTDLQEIGAELRGVPADTEPSPLWNIREVAANQTAGYRPKVVMYAQPGLRGQSRSPGLGRHDQNYLVIGAVRSIRVEGAVRVILHEHPGFTGRSVSVAGSLNNLRAIGGVARSVEVKPAAILFEGPNFTGKRSVLAAGSYDKGELRDLVGVDTLSSIRIPPGIMVAIFDGSKYRGPNRLYMEDVRRIESDLDNKAASVVVIQRSVVIPRGVLHFGSPVQLHNKEARPRYLHAAANDRVLMVQTRNERAQTFSLVRAGPTKHSSLVCFGDVVALRTMDGRYLRTTTPGTTSRARKLDQAARFRVVRAGATASDDFVTTNDEIALVRADEENAWSIVPSQAPKKVAAKLGAIRGPDIERLTRAASIAFGTKQALTVKAAGVRKKHEDPDSEGYPVGCTWDACGQETCGQDACMTAACGVALSMRSSCFRAADLVAICGAESVGVGASLVSVCGTAEAGFSLCGADACGADVMMLGVCGADVCGAAACMAAACGADASLVSGCGMDACGKNACVVDACGVDACGAEAKLFPCGVDVVPVVPGI